MWRKPTVKAPMKIAMSIARRHSAGQNFLQRALLAGPAVAADQQARGAEERGEDGVTRGFVG